MASDILTEMAKAAWQTPHRYGAHEWDKLGASGQEQCLKEMRAAVERLIEMEEAKFRAEGNQNAGAVACYLRSILEANRG